MKKLFGIWLGTTSRSRILATEALTARCLRSLGFALGVILIGSIASATTVRQFDLNGLVQGANRIFRARVVDVKPGTIEAGGGSFPTMTYRLKIEEALRGVALGETELTMVADPKGSGTVGSLKRYPVFADIPKLEKGGQYLLFATAPSRIGLCTFVGLGQGCFKVRSQDKNELAVNGFNNAGLGLPSAGAISYQELVTRIRGLINK